MKRKANDSVPEDEMLLAAAIAAAESVGARWCRGEIFIGDGYQGDRTPPPDPEACCALGALLLAGYDKLDSKFEISATIGNDSTHWFSPGEYDGDWHTSEDDGAESMGYAYHCAMESV